MESSRLFSRELQSDVIAFELAQRSIAALLIRDKLHGVLCLQDHIPGRFFPTQGGRSPSRKLALRLLAHPLALGFFHPFSACLATRCSTFEI
jgi:hypothetical protein